MKRDIIKYNDRIDINAGYLIVKGYNGSIVYLEEYGVYNDEGDMEYIGKRMLTLLEIGHELKNVDGQNHMVTYWND